jgi:lambda family phage portal protein
MGAVAHHEFDDLLGPTSSPVPSESSAPAGFRVPVGAGGESAIVGDAYEGASLQNRELAMWQPPTRSADRDMLPQKLMSDARVRDTLRNDAYVLSGATLHQDNIVGGQFLLNSKPATKILFGKEDEKWEEEFQEEVEERFTLWAESPDNWVDASRRMSFTAMVRQSIGSYLAMGEVLSAVEWARDTADIRPFNTSIRMVDLDRLSTPADKMGDRFVIAGVRVDRRHIPQGYYIRKAHPTDLYSAEAYSWEYIQARKPWGRMQVIHLFDQRRPYQTRGISDMVAALKEIRMTKHFRETVLQNAVVNATYAASIESDLDTRAIFDRLGGGNLGESIEDGVTDYIGAYLGAVEKYVGASNQFQIGGVRIPHLPPGSKLQLRPAGQGGPLGTEFEQSLLRYIAASLGVSYEQLSRDYTKTNYSSARAAMTETWKFMQSRKRLVADKWASHVYRLWLEEALNKGVIQSMPRAFRNSMDWFYTAQARDAISKCEWVGASRGQIDELKETQAAVLRGKYNLTTDEDELSRLGKDWRAVYRQRSREKRLREELGIETEVEDNMVNAVSGAPREKEAKDEKDDGSDSNTDARATDVGGTVAELFMDAMHDDIDERPSDE